VYKEIGGRTITFAVRFGELHQIYVCFKAQLFRTYLITEEKYARILTYFIVGSNVYTRNNCLL